MLQLLGNKAMAFITKYLSLILLVLFCISLLIPLFWMVYTSFKTSIEYFENTFALPKAWTFSNYKTVLPLLSQERITDEGIRIYTAVDMLGISLLWATSIPFVSLLFTLIVAYVMSKYQFVGNKTIFAIGIFMMITPIVGNLPSTMVIKKALHIYDSIFMHIVTAPGPCFTGMWFLLFYASWKGIPWSYAEAAFIDGAGHASVMVRIMLPMMIPTFSAVFLLNFLSTWNDYSTFIIWLPSYVNLAYGMYLFQLDASNYGAAMPQVMAGFIVCMLPTVAVYLCSQKLISSKLTVGGLKG